MLYTLNLQCDMSNVFQLKNLLTHYLQCFVFYLKQNCFLISFYRLNGLLLNQYKKAWIQTAEIFFFFHVMGRLFFQKLNHQGFIFLLPLTSPVIFRRPVIPKVLVSPHSKMFSKVSSQCRFQFFSFWVWLHYLSHSSSFPIQILSLPCAWAPYPGVPD